MSFVRDGSICAQIRPGSYAMSLFNQNNLEGSRASHSRECSRSIPNRQRISTVIPVEVNRCPRAMLVCIAISTVFVQLKVGIFATVDTNLQRLFRLRCRLYDRTQGHYAARLYKDWNSVQRSICCDRFSPAMSLPRPEINPVAARRQSDASARCTPFCDGIHQKRITEQELIADVA